MLFYCEKYLKLTNFSSIILQDEKELIVKSKSVNYIINGTNINIKYYCKDEIIVQGKVDTIKFEYEK
ncbi:MAG: YabP/YqfC family sporulation protein [Bacilli bacterium]